MLLKRAALDRIVAGEVDLVFRRWKRPTVKAGGQLRTSMGMLEIASVDRVPLKRITAADARRAGYDTRTALVHELASRVEGDVYRIEVRPGGDDPRIALRNDAQLSTEQVTEIRQRLDRLDRASTIGPWTRRYLEVLAENPRVRAQDLAEDLGLDKPTFKNNVRKLKALGLTISHSPGYELSPRGRALLDRLHA